MKLTTPLPNPFMVRKINDWNDRYWKRKRKEWVKSGTSLPFKDWLQEDK